MTNIPPPINSCALSETGPARAENQDAIAMCDPARHDVAARGYLYGIADGMGGYEHGHLAATLALESLFQAYYAARAPRPAQSLNQGVLDANFRIYQTAQQVGARMGTTLTAVGIAGNTLHLAHVGDSRAYLVRHHTAKCLTSDHTTVGDLVRLRMLGPDKVRGHAQRSVLNRCLGLSMFVHPDLIQIEARPDDVLILCSDGVWGVIEDDEFARLTTQTTTLHTLSQDLINLALDRHSDDNVSVVAIGVRALMATTPQEDKPGRSPRLPRWFGGRAQHAVELR